MTAVIFDMDGVLVDGEPLHFAAVREILADEGAELSVDTYRQYLGTTLSHTWNDLRQRYGLTHDYEYYAQRYDAVILDQYRNHATLMPGARSLMERLQAERVTCALASSSNRNWVETALGTLGLRDYFDVIVAGDEVAAGKPDPEIYLMAAEKLGLEPAECLVVEDAPAGIESGRRAGMRVIAVRTDLTQGLPLEGAERIIDTLDEFELCWLKEEANRA